MCGLDSSSSRWGSMASFYDMVVNLQIHVREFHNHLANISLSRKTLFSGINALFLREYMFLCTMISVQHLIFACTIPDNCSTIFCNHTVHCFPWLNYPCNILITSTCVKYFGVRHKRDYTNYN